ncbi:MAG: siderophore ABC transporter substrate-binding protein [Marinibacterium sp.]|nr:siderophore ABC transporter substrate-binding protein [Marinibacterium sp.]
MQRLNSAFLFAPIAAVCLALGSAAHADSVTVDTARGPAEVPFAPQSVAVYDIAALDTIDALDVPVAATVDGLYVDYLDHVAAGAQALGTFWEPDFEGLNALSPDLIVVGSRSADQLEAMSRIAPSIDMTVGYDALPDAKARLRAYGEIFGKTAKAQELEQALDARLAEARAALQGKGTALVVMTNGPKISAYGAGGRFGWLHRDLGMPEAAPEIGVSTHGETISFEFIRDANPDWLIVVDRLAAIGRPGAGAKATLDNALVHETTAWKTGQVIYLNAADIYIAGGGIQSTLRVLDDLIAGFTAG